MLRRWPWFVAILVLLSVGTTAAAVRADHHRPARSGSKAAPVSRWDPRVAALARFVERTRGLRFEHPVRTVFLSDEKFRATVTADQKPTAAEERDRHHLEGVFRALGLVQGELDLDAATDTLAGEEVLGLYDPETDRILIRGDRVTLTMRPTIVHELTHALQSQHFDLEPDTKLSGEDTAFTSLVEADAMRIEDRYVASLPDAQQREVDRADQAEADAVDLRDVPPILGELFSLPYVLGPPYLDGVSGAGGDAAINRTFRHPPVSEEQIIDSSAAAPVKVRAPALPKGAMRVDDADDFGMVSLLLVLGERLPFPDAWAAVEGWAGDASVGYRQAGRDCIAVRVALDTDRDAAELDGAVALWSEGRSLASHGRRGRNVDLTSCDPGAGATGAPAPGRPRTFELLQLRIELVASLERGGGDRDQARCVVDAVFRDHDPAQLLTLAQIADERDPRLVGLQRDVAAAARRCGASAPAG